jgi:hypothetical protein
MPGCTHANCANCAEFALTWRAELVDGHDSRATTRERQMTLDFADAA